MLRVKCMWFTEQLNSFLNLGICKEYPNMARAKSTSSKANRASANTNTNKDQASVSSPGSISELNAVHAIKVSPTEIKPETSKREAVTPEPRKLELRKTESRKNVFPINLEDEIRRRAYELYLQREPGSGSQAEDWLNAEREVTQRYHQQSA
jgi:hypothetical protein